MSVNKGLSRYDLAEQWDRAQYATMSDQISLNRSLNSGFAEDPSYSNGFNNRKFSLCHKILGVFASFFLLAIGESIGVVCVQFPFTLPLYIILAANLLLITNQIYESKLSPPSNLPYRNISGPLPRWYLPNNPHLRMDDKLASPLLPDLHPCHLHLSGQVHFLREAHRTK